MLLHIDDPALTPQTSKLPLGQELGILGYGVGGVAETGQHSGQSPAFPGGELAAISTPEGQLRPLTFHEAGEHPLRTQISHAHCHGSFRLYQDIRSIRECQGGG